MDNQNQAPGSNYGQSSQPTPATPVTHFDPKDVEDNKVIAALSYVSLLCLIPLLVKKDSRFCQEHGKQGLVLFILEVAIWIVGMLIPFLGWFIIAPFGTILVVVLAIIGIINALSGKFWEIPVIGQYRKQINL